MDVKHAGEYKTLEVFLEIAWAHLSGHDKHWYTTDRLLHEALVALSAAQDKLTELEQLVHESDAILTEQDAVIRDLRAYKRIKDECFKENLRHQDVLAGHIKRLLEAEYQNVEPRNRK